MNEQSVSPSPAPSHGTILVADDERHIVQLIKLYLGNEGFGVETASNGQEALAKINRLSLDLLILDLMMPHVDGWEVCRRVRRDSDVPIIMLTARADDVDKIVGLELGADDYVTKPFNPRELVARVKAVLRRTSQTGPTTAVVEVGDLRIDPARREVTVASAEIKLRMKEFDLLLALARQVGVVLTREMLLSGVWGYDYFGESRTVDVHVTWLRSKIAGSTAHIETVRGVGYKLVGPAPERRSMLAGGTAPPGASG
jgi:DNA-binding response OmpR family regulator